MNAMFYDKTGNEEVICRLCPHECRIKNGHSGICGVRINQQGVLNTQVYGRVSALHFDPIEKKPLYHFCPGETIFSVGSIGCNLKCKFCQNSEISQTCSDEFHYLKEYLPDDVVEMAGQRPENLGIAFTYNEPVVWFEYMFDIAQKAKKAGLKTVLVTNGFINQEPLQLILPYIDAFSVDLKAFHDDFYKKITNSRLQPVLNTLKTISANSKHLEITNLVIPTLNDDRNQFEKMVDWIFEETGEDTVLHLSRYFPSHLMNIEATPSSTLIDLFELASSKLNYVYLGNVAGEIGRDTRCKICKTMVISRNGYNINIKALDNNGYCTSCRTKVVDC